MATKKFRNMLRPAKTRNFSLYTIERYIYIDDEELDEEKKNAFVKEINERLWLSIQETNALAKGRVLPFVNVRRVIKDESKIRIVINDLESDKKTIDYVDLDKTSHVINFKTLSPQRVVMVSDNELNGQARMILDRDDQISAAVDVFLDIAMFNAISFLKDLSLEQKQDINTTKIEFLNSNIGINNSIYYRIDSDEPPTYFSFAFFARTDYGTIDYEKYVNIWDEFLNLYFENEHFVNERPEKQLEYHRDRKNIESKYFDPDHWLTYEKGDYYFLRYNSTPNDNQREQQIKNYFGIICDDDMHIGATKVVNSSEYFTQFLRRQIDELYISAFKIVI